MRISHSIRKSVAIIGGGPSQMPFIRATKERGLRTIVFDQNPECQANGVADIFFPISTHDLNCIIDALKTFEEELLSCFTYSSYHAAQKAAAKVNDYFGLVGLKSTALKLVSEKSAFRARLRDVGLASPRSVLINDLIQAKHFLAGVIRSIVKPANGSCGSAGVSLVMKQDRDSLKKLQVASEISVDGSILMEEFIDGEEYSVDGFVDSEGVKIILVSKKLTLGHEYGFAIDGFYSDSKIFSSFMRRFSEKIYTAVTSTGLSESFFSLDVIVANDEIYFIDFGCLLDAKIDVLMEYAGTSVYAIPAEIALRNPMSLDLRKVLELPISSRLIYLKANDLAFDRARITPQHGLGNLVRFGDFKSVRKPPQSVADAIGVLVSVGDQARLAWSTPWASDLLWGR